MRLCIVCKNSQTLFNSNLKLDSTLSILYNLESYMLKIFITTNFKKEGIYMSYTIGEVAKKMNLSVHTIRYYEKEGLIPSINRTKSGLRTFEDKDLEWIKLIECLKATNMPLKDIKTYIDWYVEGDSTIPQRYDMFLKRREIVENQIKELQKTLSFINFKCSYYENALKAGTTKTKEVLYK